MAKKPARKRKAATRSAAERKFVKTAETIKTMQRLLDELKEARRGPTGWGVGDHVKVKEAEILLGLTMKKLKCGPTQSFPPSGS